MLLPFFIGHDRLQHAERLALLQVLRLIHSQISGNKWRKLKFNILHCIGQGFDGVASFGGAFSNHIAALAAAGHAFNIRTIALFVVTKSTYQTLHLKQRSHWV